MLDNRHQLVCKCGQPHCVNPLHYQVVEKKKRVLKYNRSEVEELETMLDLERLEALGFVAYLDEFNTGNPLPADPVDFFIACNRKLTKGRREPLEEDILDEV